MITNNYTTKTYLSLNNQLFSFRLVYGRVAWLWLLFSYFFYYYYVFDFLWGRGVEIVNMMGGLWIDWGLCWIGDLLELLGMDG